LRLQQFVTGTVHGYSLKIRIDRGQQSGNFDVRSLPQHVQRPRAVFAAAPGEKNLLQE
jgi:hypothetical protein